MLSRRRQRWLVIGGSIVAVAALALVPQMVWRARHPAPLGRSVHVIGAAVAAALPAGTSRDSVLRYLRHNGADFSIDTLPEHRVGAMFRVIDSDWLVSVSARVDITFDDAWRVRTTRTNPVYTGP